MKKYLFALLPILCFFLITVIIFRPYFFAKQVPFPGNLLVAFYQPFSSYPWAGYPSGPPNKPVGFDNLRIFYPMRSLTIDAVQRGMVPLWNPYDFSGNMHLATYQSAVFHPMSWLFFLLPQIDAWSVIFILAPFLTMLFTYFYLRELSLGKSASLLGSVGFGLCGYVLVNTEEAFVAVYSILFLPIILLGIEKWYKKSSVSGFFLITLGTACSILSGFFQMTWYALLFAFAYALFSALSKKKLKAFFLFCLFVGLGLLLSALHLVPNMEAYFSSARGTTDAKFLFDTYLVPWYHLVTYVAPDFFGNPGSYNYFGVGFYYEKMLWIALPVLMFGFYGAGLSWKKQTMYPFFTVLWGITLFFGIASPVSRFLLYNLHLPIISTSLPARIFVLSAFCASVLAAYGLESYLKKPRVLPLLTAILIVSGLVAGGWIYIIFIKVFAPKIIMSSGLRIPNIPSTLPVSKRNLLLPTILYGATLLTMVVSLKQSWRKYAVYGFIIIAGFSSIYFAGKYISFSDRQFTFPEVPVIQKLQQVTGNNRVWSFGPGYIDRNFLTYYHLQSPEGYDALSIQRYTELLFASEQHGQYLPSKISRADAVLLSGQNTSEIVGNPLRLKLLSLLGVKYIAGLDSEKSDKPKDHNILSPVWKDGKYIVYQYKKAYPRAFLVTHYVIANDNQSILNTLFSQKTDLSKTVVLEKPVSLAQSDSDVLHKASIVSYTPNKVVIQTTAPQQTLLFLSDNYYPGWHAYVDSKEVPIYRADYTFRSVLVPRGDHLVTFVYQPFSFTLGIILSGIGVFLCLVIGLRIYSTRYRE